MAEKPIQSWALHWGQKHPSIMAVGNPGREAISWFFCAGVFFVYYLLILYSIIRENGIGVWSNTVLSQLQSIMISSAIFLSIAAFSVWMGIAYCRKAKRLKEKRKEYENYIGPVCSVKDRHDESGMPQIRCSSCGFEFDFDYPTCPHCKYPV